MEKLLTDLRACVTCQHLTEAHEVPYDVFTHGTRFLFRRCGASAGLADPVTGQTASQLVECHWMRWGGPCDLDGKLWKERRT